MVLPKTGGLYAEETSYVYVSVLVNLSVLVLAGIQFICFIVASTGLTKPWSCVENSVENTERSSLSVCSIYRESRPCLLLTPPHK